MKQKNEAPPLSSRRKGYINIEFFRKIINREFPFFRRSNMEFFKSFLQAIGIWEPTKVDFIFELPVEVSRIILRKLDAESLLRAARVSRKWLQICKSDEILKRTARRHKREIRRKMREQILGRDSPSRIESLRRIREMRKYAKQYNVASVRLEAAVVFGSRATTRVRIPPPRNIHVSRHSSSNRIKSRKPIRI